jgi:hypothetical protein
LTVINKGYEFNCIVCNKCVDFEELEKGSTFTAYELRCSSCTHSGYMFAVFVPTSEDLRNLINRYKNIMEEIGTEDK